MGKCNNCNKALANKYAKHCRECYLKYIPKGENHQSWKGNTVGYGGVHQWMRKEYGIPTKCDECGTTEAKRYEWANISGKYNRDREDFRGLCVSCHRKEGFNKGEYIAWNKGKKTGIIPKTAIKKGQRLSIKTEFKKGQTPWNKYLQPMECQRCGKIFQPVTAKNANKYCSRKCYWGY